MSKPYKKFNGQFGCVYAVLWSIVLWLIIILIVWKVV